MGLAPCSKKQEMMLQNDSDVLVLGGSAGSSKAHSLSTEVYTPFGAKPIGSLQIGDIISAPDGSPQKVLDVIDNEPEDLFRVTFDDDSFVDTSGGHLWVTHITKSAASKKTGNFNTTYLSTERLITTQRMKEWLDKKHLSDQNKQIKSQHMIIPLCDPIGFNLNNYKRPIPPYVLGALIGDGNMSDPRNNVTLTTEDSEIVNRFEDEGYSLSQRKRSISYGVPKSTNINIDLDTIGLLGTKSHNKFIPESYKYGSINQRFDLIRGLMDTDGTVDDQGHLSYTTVSKQLAEDFQWVARSLGCKAKVTKNKAGYKDKDGRYVPCRDAYNVFFKPSYGPERFVYLKRKRDRCKPFNNDLSPVGRRLVSIEKVGFEKTRCISVSHPSRLYVAKDFIVTHNSWMLHMIACKYLDCPNFKATFIRRTTPQLMKPGNLFDTGKKVFGQLPPNFRPKWKQGDQKLAVWEHGPVVEYSHCQHIKDLDNYQGSQMTLFAIDEAPQLEWEMITYLFSRMRSDSKYKSRMLLSCNPDPDHMMRQFIDWWIDDEGFPIEERLGKERYFYVIDDVPVIADTEEELIEKYPHMAEGPDGDIVRPMSLSFIASKITDNPILLKNNPRYLSALKGLSEVERKRLLDGNWDVRPEGANYFNRTDLIKADRVPPGSICARGWDKASTSPHDKNKYPDFSATGKMYKDRDGNFFIVGDHCNSNHDDDSEIYGKFRKNPGPRDRIILEQAVFDGQECIIVLPIDAGQAGKTEFVESAKKLSSEGFIVKKDPAINGTGKLTKFTPFSVAVENGLVHIVPSSFKNPETLDDILTNLEKFDGEKSGKLKKDDIPDAYATTFNYLNQAKHIPIVCRNQKNSTTKTAAILAARR